MFKKDTEDSFKLLDDILTVLVINTESFSISINSLYKHLYNNEIPKNLESNFIRFILNNTNGKYTYKDFTAENVKINNKYLKFIFACQYLVNEDFITSDNMQNLEITYKGIIQQSKSFVIIHKQDKSKRLIDKWSTLILLIISLITFLIGLNFKGIVLKCF